MADYTRMLSLQTETARNPGSELARILASSAPYNNSTDSIGAALLQQGQNPMLTQGMPLQANFGQQMPMQGQPNQSQNLVSGALPYGWGTGTGTTGY